MDTELLEALRTLKPRPLNKAVADFLEQWDQAVKTSIDEDLAFVEADRLLQFSVESLRHSQTQSEKA